GQGRGAVLNQDNTVNSHSNPAAAGTTIQIFATGAGQSVPSAATGSVTSPQGGGRTRLPVKAFLGDHEIPVSFAGPAPGFVSGALQVNAVIPPQLFPGIVQDYVLSLEVDGVRSPATVTISVR